MRLITWTLSLAGLLGCAGSASEPDFELRRSSDRLRGIAVVLTVAPPRVAPVDSIEFVATAHNSTNSAVQIGTQCGPSFDVVLHGPGGYAASVLSLIVGSTFTCELSPRHFAPANGMQQVRWRIAAPKRVGEYHAVAGLRRAEGLSNLSASVAFEVH
jgi:hypothetical protein